MNEIAQRIAIAEACGWTCCGHVAFSKEPHGLPPHRKIADFTVEQICNTEVDIWMLPRYTSDLNEIFAAVMMQPDDVRTNTNYHLLNMMTKHDLYMMDRTINALAPARCEALLRALGKWQHSAVSNEILPSQESP